MFWGVSAMTPSESLMFYQRTCNRRLHGLGAITHHPAVCHILHEIRHKVSALRIALVVDLSHRALDAIYVATGHRLSAIVLPGI